MNEQEANKEQLEMDLASIPADKIELFEKALAVTESQFLDVVKLDTLENNSVLIFRVSKDNLNLIMSLPILCEKYKDTLQPKNIAILVIGPNEKVETLNEKEMERLGWTKKEKSLIIH